MSAELTFERDGVCVYSAAWSALLDVAAHRDDGTVCDALIVDAPYSERTHAGHDGVVHRSQSDRQPLSYRAWTSDDVDAFVDAWADRTRGWIVSLTDHVLAPAWASALERAGRCVFAPIACVDRGSRVRLVGDGPSQWSVWAIAARPRALPYAKWGTLPGAYVLPHGARGPRAARKQVIGGKPLWLMERIVDDYTRAGDLVADPCCGAGTTIAAALRLGRRAIGGDVRREHAELAARNLARGWQRPLFDTVTVEGAAPC